MSIMKKNKIPNLMQEKKGAIFDMDGTLLDSMVMWSNFDIEFMKRFGLELDEEFHESVRTMTLLEAAEYIYTRYKVCNSPEEIVEQFTNMIEYHYKNTLALKPGAFELVKEMKNQGISIVIATANEYGMCKAAIDRNGLSDYIDGIITCTMVGVGKEKPDVYIKAAEMMGLSVDDCVVFEDSLFAIKTAKNAGFTVVGVYDSTVDNMWNEICKETECQVVFKFG